MAISDERREQAFLGDRVNCVEWREGAIPGPSCVPHITFVGCVCLVCVVYFR